MVKRRSSNWASRDARVIAENGGGEKGRNVSIGSSERANERKHRGPDAFARSLPATRPSTSSSIASGRNAKDVGSDRRSTRN